MTFPDHIHVAAVGDDVVLLDERDGRYLCLEGAAAVVEATPGAPLVIVDEDLAVRLSDVGLAVKGSRRAPTQVSPQRSYLDDTRPNAAEILGWLPSIVSAQASFHASSFSKLLETARRGRNQKAPQGDPALLSGRFMQARPWLPFQGLCLKRCYLQLRLLQSFGQQAHWVFGVRTWPFGAHCWLQQDGMVLSDQLERVLIYEPILSVPI